MLNSQNYFCDEKVIQVGEMIASEIDYKDPNVKVYYHRIKGAQTHMPDGAGIRFVGGMFATSNKQIKEFLDKIADKPGTQVYTKQAVSREFDLQLAKLADEASQPTGNVEDNLGKGVATQEMMLAVDANLQSQSTIGSEAEQALAIAELRNQGQTANIVKRVG